MSCYAYGCTNRKTKKSLDNISQREAGRRKTFTMLDISYYPFLTCNWFAESFPEHRGTLEWEGPECSLKYTGQTLLTHCHGKGELQYTEQSQSVRYSGHFYTSAKQGYGLIYYPNRDDFQGLFKNNIRFGPGVYTQANGCQSRGFWVDDKLMRLSDTCFDHIVPTLAESPAGKKKLQLYYQTLIDLTKPKEDRLQKALKAFHAPPEVVKNIHFLYNYHLKDPGCLAFDRRPYLRAFYGSGNYKFEDEFMEYEVEDGDEETESADEPETTSLDEVNPKNTEKKKKKKKPLVPTHLLAWNNSYLIIKIQRHCFKNRKYEKFLPVNITGIIEHVLDIPHLAGDHQTECYKFLSACASGDAYLAFAMVKIYDISPDVSDGCGNTGFLFAAAQDNLDLIDGLSRAGANPNLCNDEGFSALTLCLTRYLAVINKVESWEKAFLPPEYKKIHEGAVILRWPPGKVIRVPKVVEKVPEVTVRKESTKGKAAKHHETIQRHPEFIFNLDPIPPPEDKKGRKKSSVAKKNKNKAKAKEEEAQRLLEEEEIKERARVILKTVCKLLKIGASPNNSAVPRPPLILAIYSKDIELVKLLLKARAHPNIRTAPTDGGLSPLHVLALMVPCQETLEMCEILLKYGANPDVRAKREYSEEDAAFDFTDGECKCLGKNVLHTLCMRADANLDKTQFLRTMLQMLVEKGADCEALYLGNSPLTLALMRGNVDLVKALLETRKANPNQSLTAKVAVPLGVLMTRSGTDKVPPNDILEMCKDLLDYGADPLLIVRIEDRFEGNLVELGYDEIDRMVAQEKATKHSAKKEDPVKQYRKLVDLVCKGATQSIINAMQKKMARVLLHAVLESKAMYLPTSLQFAASWLTTEELIEHWTVFTSEAELILNREDVKNVLLSVDLMERESREDQVEDVFEALEDVLSPERQELLEESTPELRKKKTRSKAKQINIPSDIDMTAEKYQVCFDCGRRVGPEAIVCSLCNIVMFCSEKCKQNSDKKEGLHKCLGWAERLKSLGRTDSQAVFLKKGSRDAKDAKRRSTKGKEMADLERLLRDSELALKKEIEEKKKKKKKLGVIEEEEEEGDGKSKLKKKKEKSAAEKEDQEEMAKKQKEKKKKKLEGESEEDEKDEKKKKGKKGGKGKEGLSEDEEDSKKGKDKRKGSRKGREEGDSDKTTDDERKKKAGSKKGKKGEEESEDTEGRKSRGKKGSERRSSVTSYGSTDKEGRRKSRRKGTKGETSEEDVDKKGRRKRTLSRHGKREDSAKGPRAEERAHSERRETAQDRKSTAKGGKGGDLDEEELGRYEHFLQYVSGSAARGMDLNKLLLPYTVLRDGSLYYKLYGEKPLFVENYSHN